MPLQKSGQPIQTTGNNLVGLWRPSFVKVDHRLFVYGGGGNVTNDLHILNLCDMRWETIHTVKGTAPYKRYGHTATLWSNFIIVFGGCNEFQEYCDDIHMFDLEKLTWFQPRVTGAIPARYLHSAVVFGDKLFVYGGFAKNSDCTYVLEEMSVLDLKTFTWTKYHGVPPRYNHSATLVGHKMYIYAGKDEHGNTVSDLFVVNLNTPPYTPHLVLRGSQSSANNPMVLLKSQHFCETVCGKLLVFGQYIVKGQTTCTNPESMYGLWMLDLDTLVWTRQECNANFEVGGWNYFTVVSENIQPDAPDVQSQVMVNNLFFLGNTDPLRPQGYDHFRDALVINGESLGLYDIPPVRHSHEFAQLLNNPELSDFVIVPANGQELHVHQVILIARWPHFRNVYKSGMIEAQSRRMELPEPYEVVVAFLKYLYSDRIDDDENWEVICEVMVIANLYLLHRLKKICCDRLYHKHMSIESCGLIFEKAIMADEPGLKMLTLNFMFRNHGAVLKSNTLLQMPASVREEFLEAVPDEAVLEIGRFRSLSTSISLKQVIPPPISTPPTTASAPMMAPNNSTVSENGIPQQHQISSLAYSNPHTPFNFANPSTPAARMRYAMNSSVQPHEMMSTRPLSPSASMNASSSMSVGV
ncbi:hypothetical protein DFQ29_002227 [Apophysomyces sp. BC1021]|nr:hypothetical protein DFQ29_002227 [Apophysomyces sp. BC1021]